MTTSSSFIQAFGFSIPVSKGGRKTWPDGFRASILEKLDAGELTIQQVTKECGVSKSLVYQWRMQAQGKPVTAAEWRAKAQFAEVVFQEDSASSSVAPAPTAQITISGTSTKISLPRDYPVAELVQIIRALGARSIAGVGS